jgi:hypothetical protein
VQRDERGELDRLVETQDAALARREFCEHEAGRLERSA